MIIIFDCVCNLSIISKKNADSDSDSDSNH